ncbi:MAG: class I SAM-dependent methyltransferase [Clostridiales bacterium]|nr:class I SAM-dependent methyltransferase [Clostridiales bacterium]
MVGEFMSTVWSKEIQSSEILYYSRLSRFNNYNKDEWFNLLQIKDGMKILEVGCGPGHFTNMIKKHFPNCEVYGVDLDSGHIEFAKEKANQLNLSVNYSVEDVTKLPFNDETFDIVYSHTLVEHLPFEFFITDQKRVLKTDGKLIFINVDGKRKHVNNFEYNDKEINDIYNQLEIEDDKYSVGQYIQNPQSFLLNLYNFGFKNPNVKFKEIMFYFPYQCDSIEEGKSQIKNQEIDELYNAKFILGKAKNRDLFEEKLITLIQQKYAERLKLFMENKPVFDHESTFINVYCGTK